MDDPHSHHISISTRPLIQGVMTAFILLGVVVVALDLGVYCQTWLPSENIRIIFNITREDSPVTWISSNLFLCIGLTACAISLRCSKIARKWDWRIFGLLFIYLSLDDAAEIHERVGTAFGSFVEGATLTEQSPWIIRFGRSFPSYYWHLVYMPLFGIMGLSLLALLLVELSTTRLRLILVSAFIVLGVSQGLDFVEGRSNGYWFIREAFSLSERTVLHGSKVIEEFLEIVGMTLLLKCLLERLFLNVDRVQLSFNPIVSTDPAPAPQTDSPPVS